MDFIELRKQRLQELTRQRPEYAEVFHFYEKLHDFLQNEPGDFVTFQAEDRDGKRRASGFPLLNGDTLQVWSAQAQTFLSRLSAFLGEHGQQGQEEMTRLQQAFAESRVESGALLRACLERNRRPLVAVAQELEVPAQMLEYVLDTALAFALKRAREDGLSASGESWERGYCPLCGGLPAMGELRGDEGRLRLHCASCATAWEVPRLRCACCGNADSDTLEYFTAQGESQYRVNVCRRCDSYLKVVDNRELGRELPMDMEDINTLHLDLLAQREGFTRTKDEVAARQANQQEVAGEAG